MNPVQPDNVRKAVLAKVVRRWRDAHAGGLLSRALRKVLRYNPPDQVVVTEHAGWDGKSPEINSPVSRAWVMDRDGLRPVAEPLDIPGRLRGRWFSRGMVRFAIAPDAGSVLWEQIEGYCAGCGVLISVMPARAGPRLFGERLVWKM